MAARNDAAQESFLEEMTTGRFAEVDWAGFRVAHMDWQPFSSGFGQRAGLGCEIIACVEDLLAREDLHGVKKGRGVDTDDDGDDIVPDWFVVGCLFDEFAGGFVDRDTYVRYRDFRYPWVLAPVDEDWLFEE